MKTYLKYICLAVLILASVHAHAAELAFPRYIQKGDEGRDVLLLQQTLNGDPETTITSTGPGSPGNETDYYGELTKQAVIKLQKKHQLGTKYGFFTIYSGTLDEATRNFLNKEVPVNLSTLSEGEMGDILNNRFKSSAISPTAPFIESADPKTVENGDWLTIKGRNFSTSSPNIVNTTYDKTSTTSPDGTTLTVKVRTYIQDLFNEQSDGLTGDQKDNVKSKIPKIPMFVSIQNKEGVSNPYQIYMKIK